MYQWCEFKSRRGENKNLTAQRSNSNTVWFNFQTYICIYTQKNKVKHPHGFFLEMTNDTSITRLLTRSQERNGEMLGHYIGCKKPHKKSRKMLI